MVIDVPLSNADTSANICSQGANVFNEGSIHSFYAVATMTGVKSVLAYRGSGLREIYGGFNVNGAVVRTSFTSNGIPQGQVWSYTIGTYDSSRNIYYNNSSTGTGKTQPDGYVYPDEESALNAIAQPTKYPITYRPTNCSFPDAPTEAAVGEIVVVPVTFPDGYGLVNESNIYVTNNGVVIPSTYSNGQLTFTMPDPS